MKKTKTIRSVIHCILTFIVLIFAQNISYAQIQPGSFVFGGHIRYYSVFLPQNYQPNMPVVINLHGYGQPIQNIMDYTMMNDLADTAGFIIVYPIGLGLMWNSGAVDNRNLPDGDDVGFISALIDTINANYNIDMARIYCTGFSNGAEMTHRLAAELTHRLAAVAPIAGGLSDIAVNWNPIGPLPILYIHGTADYYNGGSGFDQWPVVETLNFWIQNNNCSLLADTVLLPDLDPTDNCTVEKISWTNCSNNSSIIHYKIINGGHHWPGANGTFAYWGGGNLNQDINANVEMWNFFKNYQNPLVNIANETNLPIEYILKQNFPNPFNPSTKIKYSVPQSSNVIIKVFDILGNEIKTVVNEEKPAGTYEVDFNAAELTSGIYFYRLQTGDFVETKKMILMK